MNFDERIQDRISHGVSTSILKTVFEAGEIVSGLEEGLAVMKLRHLIGTMFEGVMSKRQEVISASIITTAMGSMISDLAVSLEMAFGKDRNDAQKISNAFELVDALCGDMKTSIMSTMKSEKTKSIAERAFKKARQEEFKS